MPGEGGLTEDTLGVGERIGYAQVPIEAHGPTTHRNALVALGVEPDRVYVDEGQSATNRARPGLREAMAARQPGTRSSTYTRSGSTPSATSALRWVVGPCASIGTCA